MEQNEYKELVKKHMPKETRLWNVVKAFVIGGIIGAIGQSLVDIYKILLVIPTKEAATFATVTLVFFASLFTAIGFFDDWVSYGRAGFIVPITGFAHGMTSASLEYKREGLITGIGSNIFKITGSVILYGIVAAYVFGLTRLIIFGG